MIEICKALFAFCFYYTLSGFYLYIVTATYPLAIGLPILVFSSSIYIIIEKHILSFNILHDNNNKKRGNGKQKSIRSIALITVSCVMPGAFFILDYNTPQLIQYIPAWVFLCVTIISGRIYTDRNEFKNQFSSTVKILLIMLPGLLHFSRAESAITGAIPYAILYLSTGVFLMRVIRERGRLTMGRNATVLLTLFLSGAVLTFMQMPQVILAIIQFVYSNIITWIVKGLAYAIYWIFYGFFWVISQLVRLIPRGLFSFSGEIEFGDMSNMSPEDFGSEAMQGDAPLFLQLIISVLVICVVALIVFLIIRKLLGSKGKTQPIITEYSVENESLDKSLRSKRNTIFKPRNPHQAIRWYYRKYLKEGISRGAKLVPADTSFHVTEKYTPLFSNGDQNKLRDIYITTRYSDKNKVTKKDVEEISKLWRDLR